jgi:hypothetical protein
MIAASLALHTAIRGGSEHQREATEADPQVEGSRRDRVLERLDDAADTDRAVVLGRDLLVDAVPRQDAVRERVVHLRDDHA